MYLYHCVRSCPCPCPIHQTTAPAHTTAAACDEGPSSSPMVWYERGKAAADAAPLLLPCAACVCTWGDGVKNNTGRQHPPPTNPSVPPKKHTHTQKVKYAQLYTHLLSPPPPLRRRVRKLHPRPLVRAGVAHAQPPPVAQPPLLVLPETQGQKEPEEGQGEAWGVVVGGCCWVGGWMGGCVVCVIGGRGWLGGWVGGWVDGAYRRNVDAAFNTDYASRSKGGPFSK